MSNIFENIKDYIFKKFKNSKKDIDLEKEYLNYEKKKNKIPNQNKEREGEETSILLEEEIKPTNIDYNNLISKKYISTNLIANKLLPILYFTFYISTILFLFLMESNKINKQNYLTIDTGIKKISIFFNFFKLYNLNPLIFHIFSLTTGLIGILIVYLVQNNIYLKNINYYRSVDRFSMIKIYLSSFFGFFSNCLHILNGLIFFFSNFGFLNSLTVKELNISLHQLIFLVEIFFTILYGIFICMILNKLNKVDVFEKENYGNISYSQNYTKENNNFNYDNNHNGIPDNLESKWLSFKLICLIYLIFFGFSYVILILIRNEVILIANKNSIYFKINHDYLLVFFPYLLFVLNGIFYSLFYGILKYSNTSHVEVTSQIIYDKSQKNIL